MGGLIGMMLAAQPDTPIARLILNDVGAFIPWGALIRMRGYITRGRRFTSLEEVEAYVREVCAAFVVPLSWREEAADRERGEDVGRKEAEQEEAESERHPRGRLLELAHPLRRLRLSALQIGANHQDQEQSQDSDYRTEPRPFGRVVHRGTARQVGAAADWKANQFPAGPSFYSVADFSKFTRSGEFVLSTDGGVSRPFVVEPLVLERRTLPHVVRFFKDSRSFGEYDRVDRSLPYEADPSVRVIA